MGRKIPAKKHRGVKDPLVQQAQRQQRLQAVTNAPPVDPDEQPIPKSLSRLLEMKERYEDRINEKSKRKKKHITPREQDNTSYEPVNSVASLKKLPRESSREFNNRINSVIKGIGKGHLNETEWKKSLNPDGHMSDEDAKLERMEYIERKKQMKKEKKKNKSGNDESSTEIKLSRMQKFALKKKAKIQQKKEEQELDNFEPKYDHVKFGEIVHEPPSLHIKPRKAVTIDGAPRPGRKDLLLNKILNPSQNSEELNSKPSIQNKPIAKGGMKIDMKAKRRALPFGVRMRLEQSQKDAIEAYKALKKERIQSNNKYFSGFFYKAVVKMSFCQ